MQDRVRKYVVHQTIIFIEYRTCVMLEEISTLIECVMHETSTFIVCGNCVMQEISTYIER